MRQFNISRRFSFKAGVEARSVFVYDGEVVENGTWFTKYSNDEENISEDFPINALKNRDLSTSCLN